MAWFGDGLSSLSNLKGQITSFTKEVLSEGIVEETDQRTRELNEANEKCVQLQELLNSKDAEISLLRRQNCELQKAVVELNARPRESNESSSLDDEGGGGFFWDPPPAKNRDAPRNPERSSLLQERLAQATLKIRELEDELKYYRASSSERLDEINDGHRKAEFSRAKQDMLNRIIQIGEKGRDAGRNLKRLHLDEAALVNDFRAAVSKLDSHEQSHMIKSALRAVDSMREESSRQNEDTEKRDVDEKHEKFDRPRLQSVSLVAHTEEPDVRNGITENGQSEASIEIKTMRAKIQELQQENVFLTTSLDELDKEHAQSLDTVLLMKEQLSKKHESLQKAYEQLYVECNEAQTKLQLLEKSAPPVSSPETNNNSISETTTTREPTPSEGKQVAEIRECESSGPDVQTTKIESEDKSVQAISSTLHSVVVQTTSIENEDKGCQTELKDEREVSSPDDSTLRVNEILKNCRIERSENESLFESLAKAYVDSNWKKEMLERKLTDVTRELKESTEMRESLQMDCYDMQTNIESLLLQIEHLKSNLPSIPEASEERVASLETETESMSEEIKLLQAEHEALKLKNYELVTSYSILEGSLRNQENLEAEVRNTKQQLDIAKQQLDGASKNVENNENMMEDLSRRLHTSLEENNELRRKIDALETASRRANEDKAKAEREYEARIARLENEIETVTKELMEARKTIVSLEDDLANATEARNELERDIEDISLEKEHLETERLVLRENSSEKETSDLLHNLRDQLDSANREKNDLEYDLTNMRKELDITLAERSNVELRMSQLNFDNVRLVKENNELIEQLSGSEKESSERIELLQTEMNLLSHEHSTLKNELASKQRELSACREELSSCETRRASLESELASARSDLEALSTRTEELIIRSERLERTVNEAKAIEDKCLRAEEKCRNLEIELTSLRDRQREFQLLKDTCKRLEERCELGKNFETRQVEMEKRCGEFEALLSSVNAERDDLRETNADRDKRIIELEARLAELESTLERAYESATMAKETIESLSRLVKEKDEEIEASKLAETETKRHEEDGALASLRAERDDIVRLVQEKHNANVQYYAEIQRLAQLVNEQTANLQWAVTERDEKAAKLQDKEAEILWSQNELKVVRQRLKSLEESQEQGETCSIVEHSRQIAQATILSEKCNALEAALIKEQSNNRIMQNQLTESESREATAARELERLRSHLVEMEASYTEEALIAEDNRKQLEAKLLQVEEKAQNSSTVYTSASIRANQQVETLQQQMALIVQQRDEIQAKLSAAEDKVLAHTASLTNLQIVLEQFQRDKENDIRTATERLRQQLNASYKEQEDLRNEIVNLRAQLSEAKECLQAASRLTEQLDKKSERIEELNQEVARLNELVDTADQRIQEATRNGEGKVDRNLVKNLLLGFLTASTIDKSSVLRVFATVLDFDETERERIGLNHPTANGGWFSGLLGSGSSAPTKDDEASLSAAFVRFLESESRPKPQLPALTITNSSLSRPGHSRQHSSSSTQSGLLLSSITLPSFPDFVPSRNTGSILKEVLKDS